MKSLIIIDMRNDDLFHIPCCFITMMLFWDIFDNIMNSNYLIADLFHQKIEHSECNIVNLIWVNFFPG
jgi:hypothetical protein